MTSGVIRHGPMGTTLERRLRILVIAHTYPFPPRWGYATRVYQLLRQISGRHEVTLLTYAPSREVPAHASPMPGVRVEVVDRGASPQRGKRLRQIAALASGAPFSWRAVRSREMQLAIDRLCSRESFDLVQIEGAVLGGFTYPDSTALLLDEHNIDYEVFERMRATERSALRRWFYWFEKERFRRFEHRTWQRASGCAVTSDREVRIVEAYAPRVPVTVVPNGVDVGYFRPTRVPVERHTILFNGVLDYRPNLDAAEHLARDIMPILRERYADVRLTIVGRGRAADLERMRQVDVSVTGEVTDVRPFLERAAVVAVPVRMGGGTRLKVVEGLAMAKPMVSTTVGCEGVDVIDGQHLLIGDTAKAFASAVARIFDDAALAEGLGRAGRDLIEREYSWDRAGSRLEELHRRVTRAGERNGLTRLVADRESA